MTNVPPQIKCDRCGKTEAKSKSEYSEYWGRPTGWSTVENKDLCDECYPIFEKQFKEFMENK